jgi:RNA polymerase sigma-54 factor
MAMRASQLTRGRPAQAQRMNPRLIAAGMLLQMPNEELQFRLEEELALNPALEAVWDQVCPDCGRGLVNGSCWACRSLPRLEEGTPSPLESLRFSLAFPRGDDDGKTFDAIENARAPLSLQDHVREQARLALSNGDFAIAEYLVAGLSDDGLMETAPEEAAEALGVPLEQVQAVLSRLQSLDPPGVCACTVQESVLLQLGQLAAEADLPGHIETILRNHWRDLANHAYAKIGRTLDLPVEEVEEAVEFIRHNFCPYPGRLYHQPHEDRRHQQGRPVRPDIIVHKELAEYVVEIVRPFDYELKVGGAYQRLASAAGRSQGNSPEYLQALEHYRRATWLLQSIQFREQTLRQIAEYTVEVQRPFLDTGLDRKLKRLTRTRIAEHIGKEVSTVSRATSGKYVLLPGGELVPFSRLLSPSLAPKTIVAELLSAEDPDDPLTDEKIARILQVRGFKLARRTVAKYRLALRLPSSTQRGRH